MFPKDWRVADELDWLVPAVLLTAALTAFTLVEIPRYSGIIPALLLLPLWLVAALAMAGLMAVATFLRMMRAGIESPIALTLVFLRENWKGLLFIAFGVTIAGLNMVAFMWVKPLLNELVPFHADPVLAAIDHRIFGTDPWRLLTFLNTTPLAIFYHRMWFALMVIALLVVLRQPASPEKSALLTTYFLLWSLFGPLVHTLIPAGGPAFYAKLGYGNRFAGLVMGAETQKLADFLWQSYLNRTFEGGSGISAMPSLHIATCAWMVFSIRQFARSWLIPMSIAVTLIFLLSISLGWHYAVDGLVGAMGAYVLWQATLLLIRARSQRRQLEPVNAVGI